MADFEWTLRPLASGDGTFALLQGPIDQSGALQLRGLFAALRGPAAILDLAKVRYVNSTGLGMLVKESDWLRSRGARLVLVRVPAKIRIIIEMLGLNAFFDIAADEAAALALLGVAGSTGGRPVDDKRVRVTDPRLTASFGDKVLVGSAFAFFHEAALDAPGLRWVKDLLGETAPRPRVVSLLGRRPIELPGATVQPAPLPALALASVTSDKALYREGRDTVHLLALDPLAPGAEATLLLSSGGAEVAKHPVRFDGNGAAAAQLRDLPAGEYSVRFARAADEKPACEFSVAEYRLAPLVASLASRRLTGTSLEVALGLESFGVAVNGDVRLELVERGRRLSEQRATCKDGVVHASFVLDGEGPHAINVQLAQDSSKTASVPIVGSRKSERARTTFSTLGAEVFGSLLPGADSKPVRGIHLEEGAIVTTPFRLERVDARLARLKAATAFRAVRVVTIDPAFPKPRPGALDPLTAPHPARTDARYVKGEEHFKAGRFSHAREEFEVGRRAQPVPHPNYAYYIACCEARTGERASAVTALRSAIEEGWTDLGHMARDEDLASLRGFEPFEALARGGISEVAAQDVKPGQVIEVAVPSPVGLVAIGGWEGDRCWEGWTAVLAPDGIAPSVKVAERVAPSSEVAIEVDCGSSRDASVYVVVKDARLLATDTPASRLASGVKDLVEAARSALPPMDGPPRELVALGRFMAPPPPPSPPGMMMARMGPPPTGMAQPAFAAPKSGMARALANEPADPFGSDLDGAVALGAGAGVPFEDLALGADEPPSGAYALDEEAVPDAKPTVTEEPEVIFAGLLEASAGKARATVQVGAAFADYLVEAFVLAGLDWAPAEARFRAEKDPRAALFVPPYVHPDDEATGRLEVGGRSGRLRVRLDRDGEPVALAHGGKPLEDGVLTVGRAQLTFPVKPGVYTAVVEDMGSNQSDRAVASVEVPGQLRRLTRGVRILRPGDRVTADDPGVLSLKVLPGLDSSFTALVEATADYGHACCEQTGAKLVAAVAMYALAGDDAPKRARAESIIIAGVRREQSMWLRGRGFKMYPESSPEPHEYYTPKVARYLFNLELLRPSGSGPGSADVSPALASTIEQGLAMARDAAHAVRLPWPPREAETCEDAYLVLRFGARDRRSEAAALELVRDRAKNGPPAPPANPWISGAVPLRVEAAFAAAALLRGRDPRDTALALELANTVIAHLNEQGRLYSTLDSVAAIALVAELRAAGIVGPGKVRVDGRQLSTAEAAALAGKLRAVEPVVGVTVVEVLRTVLEDWGALSSKLPLRITLEKGGRPARRFTAGDGLDLRVRLEGGYKPGDLLWVCLPEALSRVVGGGQVKKFAVDFEGRDELLVALAATGTGEQRFALCVRNMFEEERAGSPGFIEVSVAP